MTPDEQAALNQVDLAEAELAVLKQELVLQHLIGTREPTEDARVVLQRLRDAVAKLTAGSIPPDGQSSDKAA
jgi:hypothetical protein